MSKKGPKSVSSTAGTIGSLSSGMGRISVGSNSSSSGYGNSMSSGSTPRDSRVASAISHYPADKPRELGPREDRPYKQQCVIARPVEKYQNTAAVTFSLQANFHKIELRAQLKVYHYDVQIYKQGGADPMRHIDDTNPLFWEAHKRDQESRNPLFPHRDRVIFNGVNSLYSVEQVVLPRGRDSYDFKVDMDRKYYKVRILYTGMKVINPFPNSIEEKTTLQAFLDMVLFGRVLCTQNPECKDFYKYGPSIFYRPTDAHLRKAMEQNLTIPLGKGLEAWTGFFGAVKVDLEYGTLINIDIKHSGFYMQDRNLVEFYIEQMIGSSYQKAIGENANAVFAALKNSAMNQQQRDHLEKLLKGQKLTFRRPGADAREKIFKFQKISNKSAADYTFQLEDRTKTNVAKYFAEQFKYNLKYPYLPLVGLDAKGRTWAPMELVFTSKTPYRCKGQLPEFQRAMMVRQTAFPPRDRQRMISDMVEAKDGRPLFLAEQDDRMRAHGVKFEKAPVRVKASLIPAPALRFGENLIFQDKGNTGQWTMQNGDAQLKKIVTEKLTLVPMIVHITPGSKKNPSKQWDVSRDPLSTILQSLHFLGCELPLRGLPMQDKPIQWDPEAIKMGQLKDNLANFKREALQKYPGCKPIVFFVIPYKCTSYPIYSEYSKVKWMCDVFLGLHCQFLLLQTYNQCAGNALQNSTSHNIALKVLAKIGAIHHTVDSSTSESWKTMTSPEHPTLVMGIDVTHPGAIDRLKDNWERLSVASVVGNTDLAISRFESSHRIQDFCQEMTVNLQAEFDERIRAFHENAGVWPKHIVIYRDGIAESMFQEVLYEEKNALLAACKEIEPNYRPTISYLVMTKRHRTKFFALKPEDALAPLYNLKPGTLVESGVTSKIYYDFYLYSHPGAVGTSRPAHYYVLWDEWQPSPIFWQEATFALTYGYLRCLKSISQASPIMYAHLAAKRAKDYLDGYFKVVGKPADKSDYEYYNMIRDQLKKNADLKGMLFV